MACMLAHRPVCVFDSQKNRRPKAPVLSAYYQTRSSVGLEIAMIQQILNDRGIGVQRTACRQIDTL